MRTCFSKNFKESTMLNEIADREPVLVPLSALEPVTLPALAAQLAAWLADADAPSFADVAFTLQVGREALPHRVAIVATSGEMLRQRLAAFADAPGATHEGVEQGVAAGGEPETWTVARYRSASPEARARGWAAGGVMPWRALNEGRRARRVSLPGYPFERRRHWAADATQGDAATDARFRFDETAFFLRDHQVNGRPIVPGVMFLELCARMLRDAGEPSVPLSFAGVVWRQPAWGGVRGVTLSGRMRCTGDGRRRIDIASEQEDGTSAVHFSAEVDPDGVPRRERFDLDALRAASTRELDGAACYPELAALGFDYGPEHRRIERLWTGGAGVLAALREPDAAAREAFVVHPGVFDAALQAALGLAPEEGTAQAAAVPFALERFALHTRVPAGPLWAWVRQRETTRSGEVRHIDVDLLDAQGVAIASLRGLSARVLAPPLVGLRALALDYFRARFARSLRLQDATIKDDAQLEQYGIDSVIIIRLTDELEETFGRLPKTLFFEHQTLGEVVDYFVAHHAAGLQAVLGGAEAARQPMPAPVSAPDGAAPPMPARDATPDDIAIIGLAGRYPGARDMHEFWTRLAGGEDLIREIPPGRWDHARYYDPAKHTIGKTYCRHGGFIDDVDKFDPLFFGISPREAIGMEPQERLFLECAYEALQDAGYTRASLPPSPEGGKGRHVGVFVGVMYEEYQLFGAESGARGRPFAVPGHPASIANRVSYLFNLQGPSLALDTMCSSSITSLHLASRSILDGECALAIAGGVNVSIHPNKYLMLGQGGFASAKGRCESFGAGGEGYVPGEGVGAVLLKRLCDAIADGDHIHGVIKGSALNHGGKTNGYTVPNPAAQAAVISAALARAGVAPRAVSYIEAHGTGTALGDPIEIAGLSRAFGDTDEARQFCAIGSVKSNIGHCESAAGIAGISKILLQMKYGQLAPSLHADTLNPNIDFEQSPFRVQRALAPWPRPRATVDGETRELPRIAGVSSFGAGGANAHLLLEEYVASEAAIGADADWPAATAIVLSAKTPAALRQSAERLLAALRRDGWRDDALPRIAYTLQIGREAMSERLAFTVVSLDALRARLAAYLENPGQAAEVLTGKARAERGGAPVSPRDDLAGALRAWVDGAEVDWLASYAIPRPRRIGLPTYPFARERYWVEDLVAVSDATVPIDPASADAAAARATSPGTLHAPFGAAVRHPLLQANTSRLGQLRFSSRFDGSEFFLDAHRVDGDRLLPAAAFVEMFAAAAAASGIRADDGRAWCFSQLAWLQPAWQRDAALALDVEIQGGPEADAWHLACVDGDDASRRYAQAIVTRIDAPARWHDVAALRAACGREASGETLYRRYRRAGYGYGAAFCSIAALWASDDHAIASLVVPASEAETLLTPFGLPPTLLDGALQATAAFAREDDSRPSLPFSVERIEWRGPCDAEMWAVARRRGDGARVATYDIDLCDEHGLVRVAIVGYSALRLDAGPAAARTGGAPASSGADEATHLYYFMPRWSEAPAATARARTDDARLLVVAARDADLERFAGDCAGAARQLIEPSLDLADVEARLARHDFDHLVWIAPSSDASPFERAAVDAAQQVGVVAAFRLVKALQRLKGVASGVELTVVQTEATGLPGDRFDFTQSGVHGIVGTLAKEMPRWSLRHLDVERDTSDDGARLEALLAQPCDALGTLRMRRAGRWYAKQWVRTAFDAQSTAMPLRRGGVYVVIGGAGGIGAAWTAHAIREHDAQVIWIGRRSLDADIQEQIDACAHGGRTPAYRQADACDFAALDACLASIRARFGAIHGVVHSAAVLKDSTLANMDEASFRQVYFSKVDSSVNLGVALRAAPPDFVLFFSSTVVFTPPPGQANYSAGCLFQNALAARLALDLGCAVKVVDWGYWGSVGIVATPQYQALMARNGIASIEPEDGMAALAQLFDQDVDELALMKVTEHVRYPESLLPPGERLTVLRREPERDGADIDPGMLGDGLAACASALLRVAGRAGTAPTLLDVGGCGAADAELLGPLRALGEGHVIGVTRHAAVTVVDEVIAYAGDRSKLDLDAPDQRHARAPFDLALARINEERDLASLLRRLKPMLGRDSWLLVDAAGDARRIDVALRSEGFSSRHRVGSVWIGRHDGVVRADAPAAGGASTAMPDARRAQALIDRLYGRFDEIAPLLCALMWRQIATFADGAGAVGRAGLDRRSFSALASALRGGDYLTHWLDASVEWLVERDDATRDGDMLILSTDLAARAADCWAHWAALKAELADDPFMATVIRFIEMALQAIPDVLAGRKNATDVFFSPGAMSLIESIYKQNPVDRYYGTVIAAQVATRIEAIVAANPAARIRLLEVGAGTGSCTEHVLAALAPFAAHIDEYCFTDLSQAFLQRAEQRYRAAHPYLTTKLFDLEKAPAAQGFNAGRYAFVIAANVIHATRDIRVTIGHLQSLMQTDGSLMMLELSGNSLFTHLTFGLLDGWWRFADHELRERRGPALSAQCWRDVLLDQGFARVALPCRQLQGSDLQVVIGEAPGRVVGGGDAEAERHREAVARAGIQPAARTAVRQDGRDERLVDASLAYFSKLIATELNIPLDRLDVDEPLDSYGIDSIYSVRLVATLNETFSEVSNTLFFEVQTTRGLVNHFIASHRDELEALVGVAPLVVAVAATTGAFAASVTTALTPAATASAVTRHAPDAAADIAIVGMSGRYAQADNLDEFWHNLLTGSHCISEIPAERWNWREHFDAERGKWGKHYTRWGGFVRDIDAFDPLFFQISPSEAERMDPQARLFLQEAYACVEDAGYTPATLAPGQRVGVFVGAMNADYVNGASFWSIANQVSYRFDLKGPSLAVDTACSSSLSAIHLAIDSLLSGSCDCAIAGGVNLIMNPAHYMGLSTMGMLSADDKCRAFGSDADGFVDGEGVGALLLKPLAAAVEAGDHIYGVIKGSALNAGGRTSGYTVPSPVAQAAVVSEALRRSGIPATQIGYVEAHGTGTPLGDPIEIKGLADAFGAAVRDDGQCAIGSVKSNIGHCESAAGIAGVTKVLLQMRYATLVPTLHATQTNPRIDFARTPFTLQREVASWTRPAVTVDGRRVELPRSAGVSSFGAGGANAHVVIQEYPAPAQQVATADGGPALVVLSAQSAIQLARRAADLLAFLRRPGAAAIALRDLAYTLQVGRVAMDHRLAFVAPTLDAVQDTLEAYLTGRSPGDAKWHAGVVDEHRGAIGLLQGDDDLRDAVERWYEKGKYDKLLAFWAKGLQIDWARRGRGRRISLPTYPFAKERFWLRLDSQTLRRFASPGCAAPQLHPLLHDNHSTFDAMRFESRFDGAEPIFTDHRIGGRPLLPAAAQIEMVRCAAAVAFGAEPAVWMPLRLRDVAWGAPIVGDAAVTLDLSLRRDAAGQARFALTGRAAGQPDVLHGQGTIERIAAISGSEAIDLDVLKVQYRPLPLTGTAFYRELAAAGFEYGSSMRTLTWAGEAPDRLLVALSAEPAAHADPRFMIDPSLLDGALQALALLDRESTQVARSLPFAVESIDLFARAGGAMWAELRRRPDAGTLGALIDIDLYDETGGLCLSLRGLATRPIDAPAFAEPAADLMVLSPYWVQADL
ncbi:SDR family NAD(P)-dependent oxidoreductase [Burkholderia pyrrocinia]